MTAKTKTEESIFKVACRIPSADARDDYLQQVCGDDRKLMARLQQMLQMYLEDPSFLEAPVTDQANNLDFQNAPARIESQIGPYKLREQLGEGGMGVVYVAEQTEPVKRKVALKIIKPGMASRDVVARFEAERQALAMMDHPNIAKVHDGGATESGQPYFVMELVQGLPITEYCDEHRLSTDQRLKLFATVCRAVQHAHQKGIIHRDLKPSNIIVAEIDDTAVSKVIDFGIAKAVSQTLTDETLYTHFSQIVGTPLYMSPEQTGLGVVDIDTRSDVYALGVLLYELLTGRTPFDSDTLKSAGFDEMRRIIREDEPPKPSAMVSTLKADALPTISQRRGSDPRKLSDVLQGELDWLVMKALEKDRNRRYESAGALAADVERYLSQEPIAAGPPSLSYRFRKYAQRNKGRLIGGGAVAALVLIGASVALLAHLQRQQQLRLITGEVERNLSSARTAIETADLGVARRLLDQAQVMLADSRTRLPELAAETDLLQAEVQSRRDDAERYQQFVAMAEAALDGSGNNIVEKRAALALFQVLDDDQWTAQLDADYLSGDQRGKVREVAYELLLSLAHYAMRRDRDVALALDYLQRAQAFHEPTKALYWVRASCHRDVGDQQSGEQDQRLFDAKPATSPLDYYFPAEAARQERDYDRAIAGYEAALRIEPDHFNSLRNMAACLVELDHYADAAIALRACLALKPDNDATLRMATSAFAQAGKYEDALAASQRLQDQDPGAFLPLVYAGRIREIQCDYDRARAAYDSLVELFASEDRYAADRDVNTAQAYDQRGVLAYRWMQFDQSLADLDQAIALRPRTAHFHRHRAGMLAALGRTKEALAAIERAVALYETADQQDDSMLADLLSQQASLLAAAERYDEALEQFTQATELAPQNEAVLRRFAYFRANCRDESLRRPDEAVALARQAVKRSSDAAAQFALALAELRSGDYSAAIEAAEESLSELTPGPERPSAYFIAAMAHSRLGDAAQARLAYDAGLAWLSDRDAAEDLYGLRSEAEASLGAPQQSSSEAVESEADANSS